MQKQWRRRRHSGSEEPLAPPSLQPVMTANGVGWVVELGQGHSSQRGCMVVCTTRMPWSQVTPSGMGVGNQLCAGWYAAAQGENAMALPEVRSEDERQAAAFAIAANAARSAVQQDANAMRAAGGRVLQRVFKFSAWRPNASKLTSGKQSKLRLCQDTSTRLEQVS